MQATVAGWLGTTILYCKRLIFRADILRSASPAQVRAALTLVILPMMWKFLSLDYSALAQSCDVPLVYRYGGELPVGLVRAYRCDVYSMLAPWQMQLLASALLIVFLAMPRRIFLVPAIAFVWWLDSNAAFFRGNLYDIDTPLAILTLVAITPAKLGRAASLRRGPDPAARMVALSMLTYVATYYILAGLSKLACAWQWPFSVKLGNLYYISYIWFGQEMPPWLDSAARAFSELYRAFPLLDALTAAVILIEQFCWCLAPFSRTARIQVGLISATSHIVIALTSGIVFITWPFIAIAVTIPFSLGRAHPGQQLQELPLRGIAVPALAVALVALPAFGKIITPPFFNYFSFGWIYPSANELPATYALGYRDANGVLRRVPMSQAGYYEYRFGNLLSVNVKLLLASKPGSPAEHEAKNRLAIIIGNARGPGTNSWLLGKFSAPDHLIGEDGTIDVRTITRFELLKGEVLPSNDRPARATWRTCGKIEAGLIERYERCSDG
jgi:hypothetical protein